MIAFTLDEEDFDPGSLPQKDGKPVLPGDEPQKCKDCAWHYASHCTHKGGATLVNADRPACAFFDLFLRCDYCLYCHGEFWRGKEKPPAFCWQQDPEGPPPHPIKISQKACREFVSNPRGSFYNRVYSFSPIPQFIHDGETFHSGSYAPTEEEREERRFLKGTNW